MTWPGCCDLYGVLCDAGLYFDDSGWDVGVSGWDSADVCVDVSDFGWDVFSIWHGFF